MNPVEKESRYIKTNHLKKKCEKEEMSHLSSSFSSSSVSSCSVSSGSSSYHNERSNDMNSCKREEAEMKTTSKRLTEDDSSSNRSVLRKDDSVKKFEDMKKRRQKRRSGGSRSRSRSATMRDSEGATVSESASGGTNERGRERMKLDSKNGKKKEKRKNSATKIKDVRLEGTKRNALFSIKRNERSEDRGRILGREREKEREREGEREEERNRGKIREHNKKRNYIEQKYRNRRGESPRHISMHKINERKKNASKDNMRKSERTGCGLERGDSNVRHRKRGHSIEETSKERVNKKHKFSESSESDKSVDEVRHTRNRKKTIRSVTPVTPISSSSSSSRSGSSSISGNVGSRANNMANDIRSSNSISSSFSGSSSGIRSKGRNRNRSKSRSRSYGKRRSDRNYNRRDSIRNNEKQNKAVTNKKKQGKRKDSTISKSSEEFKEIKVIQRKNKNMKSNVKETDHKGEYKRRSLSSVSKSVSTLSSETEKKIKRLKKEKLRKSTSSSDDSDIKRKKKLKKGKYEKSKASSIDSRSVTLSSSENMDSSRNDEKKKRRNIRSLKTNKMEKQNSDISSTDSEETSTDSGQEMKRQRNSGKRKLVSSNKGRKDKYHEEVSIKKNEMDELKEKEEEEEEEEYDPLKEDAKTKMEINEDLIEYAKKKIANVTVEDVGKFGGVYIPPFKIERLKNEVTDTNSVLYQRQEWMKLKKKINNIVNKINVDNIGDIVYELFECNLIRGKGLFSRALIHAQLSSPAFTNVFACLLAIVNSKFPNIGLLTVHRVILHFRRAYKRNDKITCYSSVKFIAHMINQRVLHEIVGLQLCSLLLQNITNDSVQVCTFFIAEVGQLYTEICRKGLDLIFERLKDILQEGKIQIKTQYDIEKLWDYRKNNFEKFPTVIKKLDLIDDSDKIVHEIDLLDESFTNEEELNIFREVPPEQYEVENEEWKQISDELLNGSDSDEREGRGSDEESDDSDGEEEYEESDNSSVDSEEAIRKKKKKKKRAYENESDFDSDSDSNDSSAEDDKDKEEITDMTEQYLINLRKSVYLSIMSSLSFEECVHKLLKLHIKPGYEIEICNMLIDCCCMEKTFQTFYALQAERLCKLRKCYQECFEKCFEKSYNTAHRLETAKLRNCSKFFAHLLYTDAISWSVFKIITLTEETTTSSTRIFIKILIQELTNNLGLRNLYEKMNHPAIAPFLTGLFPTDTPPNIRFCINYFTAIGLGALTTPLRKLLQG